MRPQRHTLLGLACLVLLTGFGCGIIGTVANPHGLDGVAYWAAATTTAVATETRFLGTTTPVLVTPVSAQLTTTPFWTTVTATPIVPPETATPAGFLATPFWVTTTPAVITATPLPPVTTTPGLPIIGFTTPVPQTTPYYRVGSFYMHSDVYLGGPDGPVLRLVDWTSVPSSRQPGAAFTYATFQVRSQSDSPLVLPLADVVFIRTSHGETQTVVGRWQPGTEPLLARGLPDYGQQLVTPIPPGDSRTVVLGITAPAGEVREIGLLTNWERADAQPVWFLLTADPTGPHLDADRPPPPTPVVVGAGDSWPDAAGQAGSGQGMWPTTGTITRGFGCHEFYTGVDGAGYGCPPEAPWFHNGVDIANVAGTAVWSPIDGTLSYAGPNSGGPDCAHIAGSQPPHQGLGNYQRIGDGRTLHYLGHLRAFTVTGGAVSAGQTVAEMGSSGCSTGSHLHWMVYQQGSLIDPVGWAGPGP